ncbi:MAG: cytochrome c biogenesis protein CcsA [Planctomycetota bacterium]
MKRVVPYAIGVLVAFGLAVLISSMLARSSKPIDDGFAAQLDLSPLDRAAVYADGRLKSYDSFARDALSTIAGRNRIAALPPDVAYLDLMLRPQAHAAEPTVFVKKKVVRSQIVQAAERDGLASREELDVFLETGMIRDEVLIGPETATLLRRLSSDLLRGSKAFNQIMASVQLQQPGALGSRLRLVPPPPRVTEAGGKMPWGSVADIEAGLAGEPLRRAWAELSATWRVEDAEGANAALAGFVELLRTEVNPGAYPSPTRLAFESWYFKLAHLTWVWLVYLFAVALLLMAVAYKWEGARGVGLGLFWGGFALHTLALAWRWWVSGRWPNSNMFEAVTTSVWLAAAVAIVLEFVSRRGPMRNLFALGASAACMCAMMAAHYIPELDPGIKNMMPILHDLWLYIHTNVIIASYALIAMAAALSGLYIVRRAFMGSRADYARAGGAMLFTGGASVAAQGRSTNLGQVLDGATMVLIELSFLLLWAGIVMGAIWADHSWGRPWGWDPKEVFALNTFIVYIVLIHVRLKARDKGLWTAVLSIVGAGVMLFNWIVINFVISGLHSYA